MPLAVLVPDTHKDALKYGPWPESAHKTNQFSEISRDSAVTEV